MHSNKALGRTVDVFIDSGQVPGFSAAGFVYTGTAMVGVRIGWESLLCCYLLACTIYASDYAGSGNEPRRESAHLARHVVWLYPLALIALLVIERSWSALIWVVILLGLGLAYAGWFKGLSRRLPWFKDLFVSLLWSMLVPLAVACARADFVPVLLWAMLYLFVGTFVNVAICDVKDIPEDEHEGILTPAVMLGVRRLSTLLHLVNAVSALGLVAGISTGIFRPQSVALLAVTLYVAWYINNACLIHGGGGMALPDCHRWTIRLVGTCLSSCESMWTVKMY